MAAAIPAPTSAPSSTKNFHDSIRAMFTQATTGAGPANSTTSLAYHLENSGNATINLYKEQTAHNSIVIKLMNEQLKLLKKIAGGGILGSLGGALGLGSALFGGGVLGKLTDRFIFNPIGALFKNIGKAIYRYSGAEFAVNLARGLKNKAITGLRTLGSSMLDSLFSGTKALFRRPVEFVRAAGRPIAQTMSRVTSFIGDLFKPLASLTKLSNLAKIGGKALRFGKAIPLVGEIIAAGLSVVDAFSGWKNADKLLGKDKSQLTLVDKISASYGELISGLTFGATDWLARKLGHKNYASMTRQAISNLGGIATSIGSISVSLIKLAGNSISNSFEKLKTYIPSMDDLILQLKEVPAKVTAAYEDFKNFIWDGMVGIAGSIKDAFVDFFKGAKDKITGIFGGGLSTGTPAPQTNAEKAGSDIGGMFKPKNISYRPGTDTATGNIGVNSPSWNAGPTGSSDLPFDAGVTPSPARIAAGGGLAGGSGSVAAGNTGTGRGQYNPATVSSGNAGSVGGSGATPNAKSWYNFMTKPLNEGGMGYTGEQARGMVAVMQGESGKKLDPTLHGYDVNGPSGGTVQWHDVDGKPGGRLTALKNFAKSRGTDWTDIETQQQFFRKEMLSSHKNADRAIRQSQTAEDAVAAGVSKFEIPADIPGQTRVRTKFLKGLNGIDDQSVSIPNNVPTPTPTNADAKTTVGKTPMANPLFGGTSINNNMSTKLGDNYQNIINGPSSLGQALGIQPQSNATPTSVDMNAAQSAQRSLVQSPVDANKLQGTTTAVPIMDSAMPNVNNVPPVATPVINSDPTGGIAKPNNSATTTNGNGVNAGSYNVGDIPTTDEWKMLIPNGSALT